MNNVQNKIKSFSKKISIAMAVGLAFYIIITAVAIVALISSQLNLGAPFTMLQGITVGNITSLTEVKYLLSLIIAILIGVGLGCSKIFILQRIFSVISISATPFDKIHSKSLKLLAILQIVSSILHVSAYTLDTVAMHNGWAFQIDISGIVLGALLYCVALIYDYGCDLQQQSDETL